MNSSYNHKALETLIESSGLSFRKGRSYVFDCPKCGGNDKLYIRRHPPDGRFVCWVCGERDGFRGRPEYALTLLLGRPMNEIRSIIYDGHHDWQEEEGSAFILNLKVPAKYSDEDLPLDDEFQELPERCWPIDFKAPGERGFAPAAAYLGERGIDLELAHTYNLHFHPKTQRVIFPVIVGGRLLGWQGRYIHPTEIITEDGDTVQMLKILSTPGLAGGQVVMYQDRLVDSSHIVLAEGPVDAIKAHLCGGNVATMGKAIGGEKLRAVLAYGAKRVYLALDRDAAKDTMRLAKELAQNDIETYLMEVPAGRQDLGDSTLEEVKASFDNAERITGSRYILYLDVPAHYRGVTSF